MNTPFGNSITTAEHAIAMMMALARQIPEANARTQAGEWPKNDFMGVEVTGKTLGLIGAGNIGSIVASRALGLRMKVDRLRSVPDRGARGRNGRREGRSRHAARARRLHHAAHPADRRDAQHPHPRTAREDQEGRAHRQLRARRADRRGGAEGHARQRPRRRRRARRVRRANRPRKTRCSARRTSSAPRTSAPRPPKRRSTSRCRWPSRWPITSSTAASPTRSTCQSLSAEEAPKLQALHGAGRKARHPGRPAGARQPAQDQHRDARARRPSSTASRSPAPCWRA